MSNKDSRGHQVKNRAAAPVQITAEQILREAQERQDIKEEKPRQRIEDFEELHEYRGRKRKEFEEEVRRTRINIAAWIKYANWEASQGEFARARSVFERSLDVAPTDTKIWLAYTEMELKSRNIQHARNLYDRAVTLLPRIDLIWYKYVFLEELLGNVAGARQVFERWMAWEPDEKAWSAYIKLEVRYGEMDRASALYERLTSCHPEPKIWIKWAKFEEERGKLDRAREIFQMAMEFFGEEEDELAKAQSIYSAFAKLETRHKEYDRARVIYKYVLDRLPRSKSISIYSSYTAFEKQHGTRSSIESTVLGKRRIQYEDEISQDPMQYDTWFEYCKLEEDAFRDKIGINDEDKGAERVRETYERAVANVPPGKEKRYWRRYVFLWLNYALFEEIETKDFDRARDIYKAAIKLVPHKLFTFAKLWLNYAQFELRQKNLDLARKILGTAVGMCPKQKLFKGYIEMELRLWEFDRCRLLYEKYIEFDGSNSSAWIKFAELEQLVDDKDRARGIYELAIQQPALDMPELVWKAYIDFETDETNWDNVRHLYEKLLDRSNRANSVISIEGDPAASKENSNLKVWISFSKFELTAGEKVSKEILGIEETEDGAEGEMDVDKLENVADEDKERAREAKQDGVSRSRQVLERAYKEFKEKKMNESRTAILTFWKEFESENGDEESLGKVEAKMPFVTRQPVKDSNGNWVEEHVLVFPDDKEESNNAGLKLLKMAHAWKKQKMATEVTA